MHSYDIQDPVFRSGVEMIDSGDVDALKSHLKNNPTLLKVRTHHPNGGYFQDPYLIWFVANNPIRLTRIPPNTVAILETILKELLKHVPRDYRTQMDYTLALVATGSSVRDHGYQIAMMDLLMDAGASVADCLPAIANNNMEAAGHLVKRGAVLTLPVAVGLNMTKDVQRLVSKSDDQEKYIALLVAAFLGDEDHVAFFLEQGVDANLFPPIVNGFHTHGTVLHQAVSSGSIACVKLLVEHGADLKVNDRVHHASPLDWAAYMMDCSDGVEKQNYREIMNYLQVRSS
ncbi:MAG: ankyrin repeat domain-containing protein [Saprospiraceae bacterium]|nr:ankyrin repeat domain-containing protein [Saprospiraceae bacterium]